MGYYERYGEMVFEDELLGILDGVGDWIGRNEWGFFWGDVEWIGEFVVLG